MDGFDENLVTHELVLELERYRSKQKLERSCLLNWLKNLKPRDDYELGKIIMMYKEQGLQAQCSPVRHPNALQY